MLHTLKRQSKNTNSVNQSLRVFLLALGSTAILKDICVPVDQLNSSPLYISMPNRHPPPAPHGLIFYFRLQQPYWLKSHDPILPLFLVSHLQMTPSLSASTFSLIHHPLLFQVPSPSNIGPMNNDYNHFLQTTLFS